MNTHFCPRCGWESKTPSTVTVLFHPCPQAGRRTRLTFDLPDREEETQRWATDLFGPLTDAIETRDPDALLRKDPHL